jgi:hypothetical protein
MGEEGEFFMYEYVTKAEVAKYRACCSDVLNRLKMRLEKEHDIKVYVTLIGSGAKNMVMRNGKGPFDLDYNIIFTSLPQKYEKSPESLKFLVMEVLDGLVDRRFTHGKDSTSSIKYIVHAKDGKTVIFSFDVALIREEGGKSKLIHDKKQGVFIWNQIRDSGDLGKKVATIKKAGRWKKVREDYRDLKNGYLKEGDKNHPSFVVYIQAVNQVYYAMKTGN